MTAIPKGLCQCGCGERTRISTSSNAKRGWVRGEPVRFRQGHHSRIKEIHGTWNGGRYVNSDGYVMVKADGHPRADTNGYVRDHVLVVERAMGKPIGPEHPIHHVNGDREDNGNRNLVVCEDQVYHMLLERRQAALDACGHAGWMRCGYCGEWSDPEEMYLRPDGRSGFHSRCCREYQRRQRAEAAA